MKTTNKLLAVAASVAALACGGTVSDELGASAVSQLKVKPLPWTFTNVPSALAAQPVTAPVQGFEAMLIGVEANPEKFTAITQMAFMVTGTLQVGDLAYFQLVYFPDGLKKPGVVVGSSTGATWAPDPAANVVSIDLTAPLAVKKSLKAEFALRVDVNGALPFSFTPQLQTVTIDVVGVPQTLGSDVSNLPVAGDTFNVN
jgi:hypothetical protein